MECNRCGGYVSMVSAECVDCGEVYLNNEVTAYKVIYTCGEQQEVTEYLLVMEEADVPKALEEKTGTYKHDNEHCELHSVQEMPFEQVRIGDLSIAEFKLLQEHLKEAI